MCLAGLGQGKFFTDRWTQRPVFQTGHKRGVNAGQLFWRRIWQNHSANICIALHRVSGIDLYAAAAPDDYHTPAFRQNGQVVPEIHVRQQFHNHVNAASACRLHNFAKVIIRTMIEHFVRALFARELETFVTARGSEHAQTASASQLHRRTSDTAARTVHEYRLIGFRVSALEQPAICGRVRRAHGCALGEGDIWRQAMYLRRFTQRTLSIRAAYRASGVNAVVSFEFIHIKADLLNYACAIVARRVRQIWQSLVLSRADISLHWVHSDSVHPNEHFTQTRLR